MAATIMLYDPTAPPYEAAPGDAPAALAPVKLDGAVVGFIDNAKPNFNHLVSELSALLTTKYGVSRVVTRRKPSASMPAEAQVVAELTDECDVVITGSGD